jgi:trk system potassium uptake protein TrkH
MMLGGIRVSRWRIPSGRSQSWNRARVRARRQGMLTPQLAVVLGFAALILIGALALLLPASTHGGRTDLVTALFTSTSAVCVTGMVVVDTGTYWTPFGQTVLLVLMQLGGLGFVVGATLLHLIRRSTLSFQERAAAQEAGYTVKLGGHGGLIQRAVLLALLGEAVGALMLWPRFAPRYGAGRGLWFAVFDSVSAFTNGSLDLFGDFRSLADFRTDPVVLLTIAGLIITGGLSLVVVEDVVRARSWRRLTLDSKLVLSGTVVLLAAGTLLIFLTERGNPASLGALSLPYQLLNSFFHSAAARTAGFSTWDFSRSDQRSLFFLLGLMFVGGAPGSMAGGIKLTTAGVLLFTVWSTLRGRSELRAFHRRIGRRKVFQALAVSFLSLALIANVSLVISLIEADRLRTIPFLNLVFDVTSAFGTVGFSTGLPPRLSAPSQLLLAATMFIGRLGPVALALTLTARYREAPYRLPTESLRIG